MREADTLTEAQIQRYARQILLGPVGGRGQEQLLAAPVRVLGLDATAAYLAAGGSPVEFEGTSGFFAGASIAAFNPDAAVSDQNLAPGLIAVLHAGIPTWVARAVAVGKGAVVYRDGGCPDCFASTAAALELGVPGVGVQALAALAWQRIVLGLADRLGALALTGEAPAMVRCEAHR